MNVDREITELLLSGEAALDFDLHLSLADFSGLRQRLGRAAIFATTPLEEGSSWRPADFRRFIVGRLADGREERLEFWLRNHLLAPFDELFARRIEGDYGGRRLPFLSPPDLIRSKQTERESDWQDIALLWPRHRRARHATSP